MKKILYGLCILFFATLLSTVGTDKAKASSARFTDNSNGTFTMNYKNEQTVRVKLVVQLTGGKQYKYDIPTGDIELTFPLTQGNGKYTIYLCKNTEGTKYAVLQQASVELNLKDANQAFLVSDVIIDWETTNTSIKKAQSLTKKSKNDKAKLDAIYKYIVKNYSYDYDKAANVEELSKDGAYIPEIDVVFKDQKGICYDISILFASMLRSVDIPAKVVTGYTPNATTYHAWNNVYYSAKKSWKVIDATYDMQMYKAKKKYSMFKKEKDYSDVTYTY